jgi:hypothetical protein
MVVGAYDTALGASGDLKSGPTAQADNIKPTAAVSTDKRKGFVIAEALIK